MPRWNSPSSRRLLLSLYFVSMEVSQAIEVNKKVGRVGSMVADLITQQQATSKSEVDAILKIGESILQPYNRTKGKIVVTAIQVTDEDSPKVKVAWSRQLVNGSTSPGLAAGTTDDRPRKAQDPQHLPGARGKRTLLRTGASPGPPARSRCWVLPPPLTAFP